MRFYTVMYLTVVVAVVTRARIVCQALKRKVKNKAGVTTPIGAKRLRSHKTCRETELSWNVAYRY